MAMTLGMGEGREEGEDAGDVGIHGIRGWVVIVQDDICFAPLGGGVAVVAGLHVVEVVAEVVVVGAGIPRGISQDATGDADVVVGVDEYGEVCLGADLGGGEGEEPLNDNEGLWLDMLGGARAFVGGVVVDGDVDGFAGLQLDEVAGEEGIFQGFGGVEIDLGGIGKMRCSVVIHVVTDKCGAAGEERMCYVFGEKGFAGAGAAGDEEDAGGHGLVGELVSADAMEILYNHTIILC